MTPAEIAIIVKARDEASKIIDDVKTKTGGLGDTLGKVGTIAGGFLAANVVQAGVGALTGFIGDSVAAIKESIAVNAQLDAVLKSTGGVAGITAKEIQDMGGSLEKLSLFEDEAIISSSSLLLTFTKIGKDVFPQAQQSILDMAQAMNMDLQSATTMVGKALNDPIKGIAAMSKAGVQFTEDQKDMIKSMVEAGDTAGAQTMILAELETQFGGSAKAASDAAGASEAYKDRMNDLQETIGAKMLPINEKLMQAKIALITLLADKVIPVIEELYAKHWPAVSKAINDVVAFIETNWPKIQPVIEFAAEFVRTKIEGMIQVIQGIVQVVTGVIDLVSALFHGDWAAAWEALQQIAEGIINIFIGQVKYLFGSIPGIIVEAVGDLGISAFHAFADGVKGVWDGIKQTAADVWGGIYTVIKANLNLIIGLVNSFISMIEGGINTAANIDPTGAVPNVNLGRVGYLARGTRNWPGGWAVIGENGPELLNLPGGANVFSNRDSQEMIADNSGVTVNINGPVYGDRSGAQAIGSLIGWETSIAMARRG